MAKNLVDLPVELLNSVVSLLDLASLKEMRCTCSLFRELTTHEIFKTLRLFPGDESCRKLKCLLQGNAVGSHVRKVYLNTFEEDWDSDSELEYEESEQNEPSTDNIIEQIASLDQFPHLNHIALYFERHFFLDEYDMSSRAPPQDIDFRENVLRSLFSFLASSPVRPKSLAVRNFQGIGIQDPETRAMIMQVLQGLRALRLGIANIKIYPEVGYIVGQPSSIPELQSVWLSPTMSSLEHLTLYSDQYFGLHPTLDLSNTHFPRLKSLGLGNYAFCHDVQVDWIISHALTLRELYLDSCPILHTVMGWYEEDLQAYHPILLNEKWEMIEREYYIGKYSRYIYARRWYDYFTMFRTGLPLLQHFRIGKSSWDHGFPFEKERDITIGLFKDRYMVFDGSAGYTTADELDVPAEMGDIPFCHEEDKEALCALFKKIRQRLGDQDRINDDLIEESCFLS